MDAEEFLLKAIRFCENHDCRECPLDGGEDDICPLDFLNYLHTDHDKLITAFDNLVDEVENWKENAE